MGSLEDYDFRPGRLDLITLWQVLEKVQMFLNYVKELVQFLATVSEDRQDLAQIEQLNDRVFHLIKSLLAAQEGHDFVYIADLLEFELAPLLAEWQTFLAALIEPAGAGEKA